MIMRTTQKKMMSKPVISTELGRKVRSSGVSSGQPSVEWHHSAEENHVSRTSSSWRSAPAGLPDWREASSASRATYTLPASSYHAGMRCPHQSCREMHQSCTLSSQWLYVEVQCSGTNLMLTGSPVAGSDRLALTASRQIDLNDLPGKYGCVAGAALAIATNHWSVSIGSTTSPVRSQRGTTILCGFSAATSPAATRSASTALRAT